MHSTATDRHREIRFSLRHAQSGTDYTLETRLFDDGVAYRFVLPGAEGTSRVPDEMSKFMIAFKDIMANPVKTASGSGFR